MNRRLTRQKTLFSAFLATITLILMSACPRVFASFSDLPSPSYLHHRLPIWSDLNKFEQDTIAYGWPKALAGDPEGLLALYVMASGRHEYDTYETINRRVHAFVETVEPEYKRLIDPWQQGELLNRQMHDYFFLAPGVSKAPKGYDEDQSRLVGIFEDSTFNCISSSLLFIVIARHFGMDTAGVILPSHAFVQLTLNDHRTIEVETTSADGYGIYHDENFYHRAAQQWFSARGLQPSSFEDYKNRKLVSPAILGTFNMLNQHTRQMPAEDRGRMAEIAAYLNPNDIKTQGNRLSFYKDEIQRLINDEDWIQLAQFFNTVLMQVIADSHKFPDNKLIFDSVFWMQLIATDTYAYTFNIETSLSMYRLLDNYARTYPELSKQTQKAIGRSAHIILKKIYKRRKIYRGKNLFGVDQVLLKK